MGDELTLFKGLEKQHSQLHDPIYGDVVVVPAKIFEAEWYDKLRSEGHKAYQGSVEGRAVVFVQVKVSTPATETEKSGNEKVVYEPQQEPEMQVSEAVVSSIKNPPAPTRRKRHTYGVSWTHEEDKELIKCVTLGWTDAAIAEKIPGRTEVAVKQRRKRLEKHGILKQKSKGKRGRPKKALIPAPGGSPMTPGPVPTPTVATEPEKPAVMPFPEMWDAALKYGADIEGIAEEVYHQCIIAKIPQPVTEAFMRMFAEIQGHVDLLYKNKIDEEELNRTNILLRQHKHVDGQIFVPLGAQ